MSQTPEIGGREPITVEVYADQDSGLREGTPDENFGADQQLSVNEVAAQAGTIGYELLAGLTGRVPISYTDDGLS